jgi:hypothetical protein
VGGFGAEPDDHSQRFGGGHLPAASELELVPDPGDAAPDVGGAIRAGSSSIGPLAGLIE